MKKLPTVSAVALTVALLGITGGTVAAGAATPTCTNAATRLAKITAAESTLNSKIGALETRLATATAANKTNQIARISARLTTLQSKESLLTSRASALSARCPQ